MYVWAADYLPEMRVSGRLIERSTQSKQNDLKTNIKQASAPAKLKKLRQKTLITNNN